MSTNLCQMNPHTILLNGYNSGFLQAGRKQLLVNVGFTPNITHQETNLMTFTATKRRERCLGFAIEALKITFFPFYLTMIALDRLARVNLFCAIISLPLALVAGFALGFCIYIVPLTLVAAAIFASIRIAHYARTHTTIQVEGRKYYVHIPKYRTELQNTFQIEARDLSSPTYKNMQTLLGQFEQQQLIPTGRTADRLKGSTLNAYLSVAFEKNEYEQVIKFIHWGANPNLMFCVPPDENATEFGCLFALVSKRLETDKENEQLGKLYELLRERIPEGLQLTHVLELPDEPLLHQTKQTIAAGEFSLEQAGLWAEAPNPEDLYAITTQVIPVELQKTYLKDTGTLDQRDLVTAGGLRQYTIGTGSALGHNKFPDEFPNGGEVTIYPPEQRYCATSEPKPKSARKS